MISLSIKGDKNKCSNGRNISLVCVRSKLFSTMLLYTRDPVDKV